jgi:hypothetical protein
MSHVKAKSLSSFPSWGMEVKKRLNLLSWKRWRELGFKLHICMVLAANPRLADPMVVPLTDEKIIMGELSL